MFIFTAFIAYLVLTVTAVSAQSPSPTGTTIRDTVKQQVQQEINQIKATVTKKAYVGSITAKSDGSLTILNHTNQSRTALVTTDAVIKLLSNRDGTPADLKVGDFVIAMGDADGSGTLTVKRLLVTQKPSSDTRQVIYGSVTAISTSSITVKTSDKEITARLLGSTKFTGTTKAADIKREAKVTLLTTGTATLTAAGIHLFP